MAEPAMHYTPKTLGARWGYSAKTIYKLIASGEIPVIMPVKPYRISRQWVEERETAWNTESEGQKVSPTITSAGPNVVDLSGGRLVRQTTHRPGK